MIERIASHLGDFTPRLQSNTRALYQYCPIPMINFPQLDNELFCNMYYLRHLCDTVRFPDWPIREPVSICCIWLRFVARINCESCFGASPIFLDVFSRVISVLDEVRSQILSLHVVRDFYLQFRNEHQSDRLGL